MKRTRYIFPAIAAVLLTVPAQAQTQRKDTTMNRTVVVEQEYAPDIMDANKVNVLPKVEEPAVSKGAVNYATTPVPATNIPSTTMQPYMGKESKTAANPGYARLGYGNYGNLDILGNYLFHFNDKNRLNLRLQMDGMDGKLNIPESDASWNAYYYRTKAGVDFLHQFSKTDLNIGGNFGLSNFNLYSSPIAKQKFTSGDVRVGMKSTDEMQSVQYNAEANLLFYQRQHDYIGDDLGETILRTKAEVTFPIGEIHRIAIDAEMNNVFLNGDGLENYSLIEINPAYVRENDTWKLHLGIHTDIGLGTEEGLHLAPDLKVQYLFSDRYTLYAKATGGDRLNDFRRLEMLSPYGTLMSQPAHTHEHINTALGFKASPVTGVWFDLFAGYQDIENDLLQDTDYIIGITAPNRYMTFVQTNSSNVYAGAEFKYNWKDVFGLQASGTYRNWDADTQRALVTCPSFEFKLNTDIRPIPSLLLNVGYQHVARQKEEGYTQMEPISNLYLGGEYRFLNGLSVYTRVNNMLNKEYSYYLGYPSEGFNFVGGVAFRF